MKNTKKNPRVYLEDILSAIAKIKDYTKEGKEMFFEDEKTQDAVIRQISIIGEAAAKLPSNLKVQYPEIPWKKTIAMRNIIIHDYSQTDMPTIWIVVERDLQVLQKTVEKMMKETPKF